MQEKKKRQKTKKSNNKNREILLVTYFFVLLMLAVMVYDAYFVANESEIAINNTYNPRQELLAGSNVRGQILSRDGEVLAETLTDADGNETRNYPYGNLFAHVIGYSTKGKTGVELLGNITLLRSNVFIGEKIQNEIDARKNFGDNIVTTIDVSLQEIAYDALGVYSGAIVVTNPATGEILAMVSKPDFNPNEIVTIWDDLVEDEESSVLVNRATQGLYPPGSTFKIITALEYYRENEGNVAPYHFQCDGHFTFEGHTINCYHGTRHGSEDFKQSFADSCNSSFANIGIGLDRDQLMNTCESVLFNSELPLDIPYNKSSYVLTAGASSYDAMQTAIGQGKTQITPMHLNMLTGAIANNGDVMTPYLIDRVENHSGSVMQTTRPAKAMTIMTAEEAAFLKEMMEGVVQSGTGTKLKGLEYTAAGKTGSAEYSDAKDESHAWFTGFASLEDSQICVTVIVEGAGSGGDYAVPIAKRIFDGYFSK